MRPRPSPCSDGLERPLWVPGTVALLDGTHSRGTSSVWMGVCGRLVLSGEGLCPLSSFQGAGSDPRPPACCDFRVYLGQQMPGCVSQTWGPGLVSGP